jgi:hypothetical protein
MSSYLLSDRMQVSIENASWRQRLLRFPPPRNRQAHVWVSLPRQPLLQVGDDVGGVLQADGEAHHIRAGAGGLALLVGELAMRG